MYVCISLRPEQKNMKRKHWDVDTRLLRGGCCWLLALMCTIPQRCMRTSRPVYAIHVHSYMYVCMYVYVYICICIYVYTYTYIFVCMYVCVYESIYTYIYIYIYIYIYVFMYVYIIVCACVCTWRIFHLKGRILWHSMREGVTHATPSSRHLPFNDWESKQLALRFMIDDWELTNSILVWIPSNY